MWTAIGIIAACAVIAILASHRPAKNYQHGADIIDDGKPECCGGCRWRSNCQTSHVEQCAYVAMCHSHDDPSEYSSRAKEGA